MSLYFNNTCPQINECIEDFKHYSEQFIISLMEHFIPTDLQDSNHWKFKSFVEDRLKEHNSDILPLFEKLRELNSEMRSTADIQIGDLEKQLEEKEDLIKDLETELDKMQDINYELQERITG